MSRDEMNWDCPDTKMFPQRAASIERIGVECKPVELDGLIKKYKTDGWEIVTVQRNPIYVSGRGEVCGVTVQRDA